MANQRLAADQVASGFPDSRTCLLHQKLQMLNVCMERRTLRDGGLPFSMRTSEAGAAGGGGESDEEFFDCWEEEQRAAAAAAAAGEPVGRLSRLGRMLLVGSDEPLYIPITQEPVPKTEDQLEDDAEVLLKLGPDSELRTQMMSASLLSDAESFKAANPTAQLEDFIRWYSPRDWIEDEPIDEQDPFGRRGHLSARMQIPGNTWRTVWDGARPVPARRQKRLFDDTKEAEKVLHFLESRAIGQIAELTVATLFHVALDTAKLEAATARGAIPRYEETIERLTTTCCRLSRENWSTGTGSATGMTRAVSSRTKYELLLGELLQLESSLTQVRSLTRKLTDSSESFECQLIQDLLLGDETELPEGAASEIAARLLTMFGEAKRAANEAGTEATAAINAGGNVCLPDPVEKQFTLRLSGNTVSKGPGTPQFLRAILMPQEFRLCGAFSRNTTFY
ncbi:rab3 GTPase-activating protein catalytic subunit-like [Anopheles bellator]|uniref:rab3 GTPase-activating protein catalytic subunit-like n=1 Tax=Anopheles bellator TaxID=139047 RepID=UPI002647F379|nr:rab3 GTPase-activating protein catalytic subunit-like [Anopheles bellator]